MEDNEIRLLPIRGCFECRFYDKCSDTFPYSSTTYGIKPKCYIDIRDFKRGIYSSTIRGKVIKGTGPFGNNCPLKIKSVQ